MYYGLSLLLWITSALVATAATLAPYTGPSVRGADPANLTSKVLCGYQGWFNCEGDSANLGWVHWVKDGNGGMRPGNAKVDLWPDVSELHPDQRYDTGFKYPDGRTAQVFSSYDKATVQRHFEWMQTYGIDGAMVQRFTHGLDNPQILNHRDTVLLHCREAANRTGRTYGLMYDLSGMPGGKIDEVIADWKRLRSEMKLGEDPAYQHHRGKPLVAVWGVGFNDDRGYTLKECRRLIETIKADGFAVMLGVPAYWREQINDATPDPQLHSVLRMADVISPWTVGRYGTPEEARHYATQTARSDLQWCQSRGIDYLPVAFAGFSWHNMYGGKLNAIPRLKGEFLWSQFRAYKSIRAKMIYVAMFDEVDEGTAIFKCTNDTPVGNNSVFSNYEGLPPDFYLRLTGQGAKLLRGELPTATSLQKAMRE